jgi:hypothetical protein
MNLTRTINLFAFEVIYTDRREEKPRIQHSDTIVLDGGRINALQRIGKKPAGYITGLYEREGYCVVSVSKLDTLEGTVDLGSLYAETQRRMLEIEPHAAQEEAHTMVQAVSCCHRFKVVPRRVCCHADRA